jgi:hypothetical protein
VEPSSAIQDASALLTLAVDAQHPDELEDLVREFVGVRPPEELVTALLAMARSLCFVTARLVHTIDDLLSDDEAIALSEDEVLPVAMAVVRAYAQSVAESSQERQE